LTADAKLALEKQRRRKRELREARDIALGRLFFNLLECHGLRDILKKHCDSIRQHPIAVAHAMQTVSHETNKSLAAALIQRIDKILTDAKSSGKNASPRSE
jgi:hypothetical protein